MKKEKRREDDIEERNFNRRMRNEKREGKKRQNRIKKLAMQNEK